MSKKEPRSTANAAKSDGKHAAIPPKHYIHVLDHDTNVTRLVCGPCHFTPTSHEEIKTGPVAMVILPPRHYVRINCPVVKDASGEVKRDANGVYENRRGDWEIRHQSAYPDPFPLYPGESIQGVMTQEIFVGPLEAIVLRAARNFTDGDIARARGDEWLVFGPTTYVPRAEVDFVEKRESVIVTYNTAVRCRAKYAFTEGDHKREVGDEWLVRKNGPYIAPLNVTVVELATAHIITDTTALHLQAKWAYTDVYGIKRKMGDEWLVTRENASFHLLDVHEKLVATVSAQTMTKYQYCVLRNSPEKGVPQLGSYRVIRGPLNFFLRPGEYIEGGKILDVYILTDMEGILLKATKTHREPQKDGKGEESPKGKKKGDAKGDGSDDTTLRHAGERWILTGPREFVPTKYVSVVEVREFIVLNENEGIYVRNLETGEVRSVMGPVAYMLKEWEELWKKELPENVETLLAMAKMGKYAVIAGKPLPSLPKRDKTRVVTFHCPPNTATQIYEFSRSKSTSRVVTGPSFVVLNPHEAFTVMMLSGGKPKKAHQIQSLGLQLGPDFMTDIVEVETADHARLSLRLSYNWHFEVDPKDDTKIFEVKDFVGDACKAMASRVRGKVSQVCFDVFHQHSAHLIRSSIMGTTDDGKKVKYSFRFPYGLVIDSIDIQEVEPVDTKTRDSLQKSVQLAIEITTRSQESKYRHEATLEEQEANGKLEFEKLVGNQEAEITRTGLLKAQVECAAVETSGQKEAEAKGRKETSRIEAESEVEILKQRVKAQKLEHNCKLEIAQEKDAAQLAHTKRMNDLEVQQRRELSECEAQKFKNAMSAIGSETLCAISSAPDALKAKLLTALGFVTLMGDKGMTVL